MVKSTPAPRRVFASTNSNLLRINQLGLPKCFTMDADLAQQFSNPQPPTSMLRGGTTSNPLSPEEVAWAKEREASRRAREETQKTIAAIRRERAIEKKLPAAAELFKRLRASR